MRKDALLLVRGLVAASLLWVDPPAASDGRLKPRRVLRTRERRYAVLHARQPGLRQQRPGEQPPRRPRAGRRHPGACRRRWPAACAPRSRRRLPRRPGGPGPHTALAIPSPRDLGLGSAPAAPVAVDWAATHRQLDEIGAVRFEMVKLTTGGSRFSCWLPDGATLRPVSGEGASEGEAVRLCLARARQARP